jgi:hypothetical protein
MRAILDAGALVAIDRRDRRIGAMLRVYQQSNVPVRTSNAVIAQIWRDGTRQANLARTLKGVSAEPLDKNWDKKIGSLLGAADTSDVVDGHVALLVTAGDGVLTSDPEDLAHLLDIQSVDANVIAV